MNILKKMDNALAKFHQHHSIFEDVGVRPDGFCLPRQHSLDHYTKSIKLFGSPNGLCSSITESKHIHTVKKPWRASNKNGALLQILKANVRLSKISAAHIDFGHRGMLLGDVLTAAQIQTGSLDATHVVPPEVAAQTAAEERMEDDDLENVEGPQVDTYTTLATRRSTLS